MKKYIQMTVMFLFCVIVFQTSSFAFTPRLESPGVQGLYYLDDNPYPAKGRNGTWYAFGRAYEILGYRPLLTNGNAKSWWDNNIKRGAYSYGSIPKHGAIACWNNGKYGTVAIVEKINGNKILISESKYNPPVAFATNEVDPHSIPGFQGYIYLLENIADGVYTINSQLNSNMVVQVDPYNWNNGANVTLGNYVGGEHQQWIITSNGDGSYKVLSKLTGRALDVEAISTQSGANIQTWDFVGGSNQKWDIVSCGDGWHQFVANHSGHRVDVGGYAQEGTNIQQWQNNNSAAQKWKLNRIDDIAISTGNSMITVSSFERIFETAVSTVYNEDLALLSAGLCEASNDQIGNNIVNLYKNLGFSDNNIRLYSYPEHALNRSDIDIFKDNQLGFSIAHKYLGDNALIVITMRGTQDPSEMANNLNGIVGNGIKFGNRRAYDRFYYLYNDVKYGLSLYREEHPELKSIPAKNVKILITGYSLGGAGANLMGAFLTYGTKEYLQKNIFVYTIACPNTYRVHPPSEIEFEIGVCENIFNIVNSRDNIPYYPLTLKRFGRDITFESGNTSFNPVNENHKIGNYIDYILNSSDL